MTKKDYELIAGVLRSALEARHFHNYYLGKLTEVEALQAGVVVAYIAGNLAELFAKEKPYKFNFDKWYKACGIE